MPAVDVQLPERYADPQRIGFGGMGDIFRAHDRKLGRDVAIKVLAERYAHDPDLRKRFTKEALTAAQLSWHPNVITTYDVGESDDRPFIVMELLEGGTLAERMQHGPVDQTLALRWLDQAARALDAAHTEGIVHRDVKPANLLFDGHGDLHVADFGIARVVDESSTAMTAAGTVLGTAGYLSPEQALGEHASAPSDNYSLAVVAFELLTGTRPFRRESSMAEAAAHVNEPAPLASRRNPQLPATVDEVLKRALAKDPGRRYHTAVDRVGALERAVQQAPTRAVGSDSAPTVRVAAAGARSPLSTRQRRVPAGVPIAVGLALLLGVGYLAAQAMVDGQPRGQQAEQQARPDAREPDPQPRPQSPPPDDGLSAGEAARLNDQAFALMNQGRYAEALPLLERALPALAGVAPNEAFANYNMGKTLLELGRCGEAGAYLDRSEQLQGHRDEIDEARRDVRQCLGGGDGDDKEKGRGGDGKDD